MIQGITSATVIQDDVLADALAPDERLLGPAASRLTPAVVRGYLELMLHRAATVAQEQAPVTGPRHRTVDLVRYELVADMACVLANHDISITQSPHGDADACLRLTSELAGDPISSPRIYLRWAQYYLPRRYEAIKAIPPTTASMSSTRAGSGELTDSFRSKSEVSLIYPARSR